MEGDPNAGDGDAQSDSGMDASAVGAGWEDAGNSACGKVPVSGDHPLIDNIEDADQSIANTDHREGYWYNDFDHSDPNSSVTEPMGVADGASGTATSMHFSGKTSVGANYAPVMGFDLNGGSAGLRCPYDASTYRGVAFYIRATTTAVTQFDFLVPTEKTIEEKAGGTCPTDCYNDHRKASIPVTTQWTRVVVFWTELAQQPGWGTPAAFDSARIAGMFWSVPANTEFDLRVDEIKFVK